MCFHIIIFWEKEKPPVSITLPGGFFVKNLISIYECIIVEYNRHNRGKFSQNDSVIHRGIIEILVVEIELK